MPADKLLLTVHSQKGGVGKTLLALMFARHSAEGLSGPRPLDDLAPMSTLLVDLDLTGTSLADVLPLQARAEGGLPLTREETEAKIHDYREWSQGHCGLAFMNRYLFCDPIDYRALFPRNENIPSDFRLQQFLWPLAHERFRKPLLVIPSSAAPEDIAYGQPQIWSEDVTCQLQERLVDLMIQAFLGEHPAFSADAVIVDTSPTLTGMSLVALRLHRALSERVAELHDSQIVLRTAAIFVASPDVQDWTALMRSVGHESLKEQTWPPRIEFVLNRVAVDQKPLHLGEKTYDFHRTEDVRRYYLQHALRLAGASGLERAKMEHVHKELCIVDDNTPMRQIFSRPPSGALETLLRLPVGGGVEEILRRVRQSEP